MAKGSGADFIRDWIRTAVTYYKQNKTLEAKKLFLEILKTIPAEPTSLELLSNIYYQEGKFGQAEEYCRKLIYSNPLNPITANKLVQILLKQDKLEEVPGILKTAFDKGEHLDITHLNLARYYLKISEINKATIHLENAINLNRELHQALYLLGEIYFKEGKFNNAKPILKKLSMSPRYKNESLRKLSTCYLTEGNIEKAGPLLQQIEIDNQSTPEDYHNLGMVYFLQEDYKKAIFYFSKAITEEESISYQSLLYLLYSKISICDWAAYDTNIIQLAELTEKYILEIEIEKYPVPVYILNYFDIPRKLISVSASIQSRLISESVTPLPERSLQKNPDKIRIGYISTKFNISPGGVLFLEVFQKHDKSKFDVVGYSLSTKNDVFTDKFKSAFSFFRDLSKVSDKAAAEIIRNDQVDILISLAGYADGMRMNILAFKPAPIQINWEGYNESMGSDFIDYSILDETLCTDETRSLYFEKIIELPGCAMFNSPVRSTLKLSRKDFDIPSDTFVYASFNHPKKITPMDLNDWAAILLEVESSVIWIYDNSSNLVRSNLTREFGIRKVQSDRLYFTNKMDLQQHWARFKLVDLFLDTRIVNAHTTAIESLRSGLPILTLQGTTNYGRYCTSILKAAGLSDLIAQNSIQFIQKAIQFSDPVENLRIKKCVEEADQSLLFNIQKNIKNLENELDSVYRYYQS